MKLLRLLYTVGIYIASILVKGFAFFNPKLKLGVKGRQDTFKTLKGAINPNDKTLWFHCASLGEYEQGLPVFEALRNTYSDYKIVLSFFSPSGYEVRKNSKIADIVVYLPLDTHHNAKLFLDLVQPNLVIFVKYEIWPNYLQELKNRQIITILISAVFRPSQVFFKWYGGLMRSSLYAFSHIFTQDNNSKALLEKIGYKDVTVSGDTRFDRVTNQLKTNNTLPFIENFKNDNECIVFGSTWPDDDKLYLDFVNANTHQKIIIAPHNIKPSYISSLKSQLKPNTICFSEMNGEDLSNYNIFILDTIGYLSRAYFYSDIVYVGGAAGTTGLHNILEPATFGKPIIIGENYEKFPEAKTLIALGGVHSVTNVSEFNKVIFELIDNASHRKKTGSINQQFVENNKGAVVQILDFIRI